MKLAMALVVAIGVAGSGLTPTPTGGTDAPDARAIPTCVECITTTCSGGHENLNSEGVWYNDVYHEFCISGNCGGHNHIVGCDPQEFDASVLEEVGSLTPSELAKLLLDHPEYVALNRERGAIQVFDCRGNGRVVLHAPLSPDKVADVETLLPD